MRTRVALSLMAVGLLAVGCGTSGLQVENHGATTPIVKPSGPQPQVDSLDAVAFPSTRDGWAAGTGAIIATTDGGATWTQQYTGHADIRSLEFTDQRHGWAVGGASLLRTVNGGDTWSPAGEPTGLDPDERGLRRPGRGMGRGAACGEGRRAGPGHARRHHRRRLQLDRRQAGHRRLDLPVRGSPGRRRGLPWCVARPTAGRRGAPCWMPVARRPAGSPRPSSALTCRRSGCCSTGGSAAGSQAYAAYTSADAGVGWQPVVVAPMLVGSDPAFADVTPLDSYPGPFAAVLRVQSGVPRRMSGLRPAAGDGAAHARRRDALGTAASSTASPRPRWPSPTPRTAG